MMAIPIMDTDFIKAEELLERGGLNQLCRSIAIAIAAERERCAKIAESFQRSNKEFSVALNIADSIRKAEA